MAVSLKLEAELEAKLRARLGETGMTLSDYVRAALVEKMEREEAQGSPFALWQQVFDGWGSGETERSEQIGKLVKEKLRAHRAR